MEIEIKKNTIKKNTIPEELEPLAKEARKYETADKFIDNLRSVLENRLPDLREKFSELQSVTTRIKGKRGASRKTIDKAFDAFDASGRQLQREVSLALGYESIKDMPFGLRYEIKSSTDQFCFEPTSERWIDLINKRLSEITKGQKLADFHAQAIKTEAPLNPVTEEEVMEVKEWLDKIRKKHKIKGSIPDKILLEELKKETKGRK